MFYQTRSNAIILHNALPAACIEKVVAISSREVLNNKIYESHRSPRKVVLEPAWHEGLTDTTSIEERVSNAHSSKHGDTCCGEIDCRIQGLPHKIEQEDHTRKEVKKLTHQFETHSNREALKADLTQNQAYNPFSEKSKDMIHNMENVEYFEMCGIPFKKSVPSEFDKLDDRDLVLKMRNLIVSYRENAQVEPGSIWYSIDSTIRDKERSTSWRASWEH